MAESERARKRSGRDNHLQLLYDRLICVEEDDRVQRVERGNSDEVGQAVDTHAAIRSVSEDGI